MNNTAPEPSFSIVVNNHNYAQFVTEALDKALAQMRDGDELVVVDDGSTDESAQIFERYADRPGVRIINQENHGQMKAVRVGIEAAEKDIIALLDSDDYFLPGYLDRLRRIYRENPDIDYVFTSPEVGGKHSANLIEIRNTINRMELKPGPVGATKWATILFNEFVGVPTSGNSLTNKLAKTIMTLPTALDDTIQLHPLLVRLFRINPTEAKKTGLTADGVIVRTASILRANKFYDQEPGFIYRIHDSNTFSAVPPTVRRILRHYRRSAFLNRVLRSFSINARPTAIELREEILNRSFGQHTRRFLHIRTRYFLAAITSSGSLANRLSAMAAAMSWKDH
ncbi:MAG: glycosyltransferase involved in cell wall biosynthesis [Alcanivorax sp.]|jgi:glycosyltransferase involved in cell wall biosynthesis